MTYQPRATPWGWRFSINEALKGRDIIIDGNIIFRSAADWIVAPLQGLGNGGWGGFLGRCPRLACSAPLALGRKMVSAFWREGFSVVDRLDRLDRADGADAFSELTRLTG